MVQAVDNEIQFKKACGSYVIVKRDYIAESTKHGVILTAGGRAELRQETASGAVLHVGDGSNPSSRSLESKPPCAEGDRVFWSRYEERVIETSDEGDLVAVPFPAIIGVLA